MKKLILPILLSGFLLTSCTQTYMPPAPNQSDIASNQLALAANSVTHSITTLEGIRKAEHPQYQKKLPSTTDWGMSNLASIDWTGPIQPLVQRLATATGYTLRILGNEPAIPVIISIHAQNQSFGEILRNTDYQAGQKAYIYVYPKTHVIELRYART